MGWEEEVEESMSMDLCMRIDEFPCPILPLLFPLVVPLLQTFVPMFWLATSFVLFEVDLRPFVET